MSRILVVEDNVLNLRLVHDILELRGHEILQARSVDEGRRALDGPRPDIILLDVHIPGGGGLVLLAEIRAHADLAAVPVLAVTAQAMAGDRERLMAAGFDGYLPKPIDTRTFGPEVEAYARRGRTGAGDDSERPTGD